MCFVAQNRPDSAGCEQRRRQRDVSDDVHDRYRSRRTMCRRHCVLIGVAATYSGVYLGGAHSPSFFFFYIIHRPRPHFLLSLNNQQGALRSSRENLLLSGEMAEMLVGSPGKEGMVYGATSPRRALAEMQSPGRRYTTNESSDLPDVGAAAGTAGAAQTTVDQVRGVRECAKSLPRGKKT